MHITNARQMSQAVKQYRCRNVVRQVADYAKRRPLPGDGAQVKFKCILFVHGDSVFTRIGLTQSMRQVAIDFDNVQLSTVASEPACEDTFARSNLDNNIARCQVDGLVDAVNDVRIMQEVLTKSLSWPVRSH
jgi:hypothetical protein